MVKVSVIIPVFNSEDYLESCLDNIVNQDFQDIEIICIDAESTDNSMKILDSFKQEYDKIIIRSVKNKGLNKSLNEGLARSNGEYILFVDSNNTLEVNAINILYSEANKTSADIVLFKTTHNGEGDTKLMDTTSRIVGQDVFDYKLIEKFVFDLSYKPWNKMFRRKFLTENNIEFSNNLTKNYDLFYYKTMFKAEKIVFSNNYLFNHKNNSQQDKLENITEFISSSNEVINFFIDNQNYNYVEKTFNYKIESTVKRYDELDLKDKMSAFNIIRDDLINILKDEDFADTFIDKLGNNNRDLFENIILSYTAEEFDMLRKVSKNNDNKNFNKRYANLLKEEYQKLRNFNTSLISSNSWKITKIFRLK